MATINHVRTPLPAFREDVVQVLWETLTEADEGQAFEMPSAADRSVQVIGDFGSGGTIQLQGSNMPDPATATFAVLTDPQGNDIEFTAAGIKEVLEVSRWVKPVPTAGTGVDVDVYLLVRRPS